MDVLTTRRPVDGSGSLPVLNALLATKLGVPAARSDAMLRPRLIECLNAELPGRLTLVSAPAGFGKTTLVRDWARGLGRPVL